MKWLVFMPCKLEMDGKELKSRLRRFTRLVHPDFFALEGEETLAMAEPFTMESRSCFACAVLRLARRRPVGGARTACILSASDPLGEMVGLLEACASGVAAARAVL